MSAEIWVAIITGFASVCGVIITVVWGNKRSEEISKKQTDLTLYRIGELEKKQDKYNHLQERLTKNEKDVAVMKEDIKAIKERITYLHEE